MYLAVNVALGPVAGPLGRTALGGRSWEGFAMDPYLSGILSAETIKGIQNAGVIANLKVNSPSQKRFLWVVQNNRLHDDI